MKSERMVHNQPNSKVPGGSTSASQAVPGTPTASAGATQLVKDPSFSVDRSLWIWILVMLGLASALALFGSQQKTSYLVLRDGLIGRLKQELLLKRGLGSCLDSRLRKPNELRNRHNDSRADKARLREWEQLTAAGKAAFLNGEYSCSREDFIRAASLAKNLDTPDRLVNTLNNLGTVYQAEEEFEQAELSYKQAISLLKKEQAPSKVTVSQLVKNYQRLLNKLGRNSEADELEREREWILGNPVLL